MTTTSRSRIALLAVASMATTAILATDPSALGSVRQPHPVSQNASDHTPHIVATKRVPHPHVDAIRVSGNRVFAGGEFAAVGAAGKTYARTDLISFSKSGRLSRTFKPLIQGGQVLALAVDGKSNSLYVAGDFTRYNHTHRNGLVKVNARTGKIDKFFRPPFKQARVLDLRLARVGGAKRLIVASNSSKRVMSLNPRTGRDDGYIGVHFNRPIPRAWGRVAAYHIALSPDGSRLLVTGNFRRVDGQGRSRFAMLRMRPHGARLSPWYYKGFAKPCHSKAPRRIAYLQGLDWSPDGRFFDVAATGQIPAKAENIWYQRLGDRNRPNTTVCDGVARFSLSDSKKPVWINYTGGDSVWSVSDTGAAVYVQGHFRWFNNPDGYASKPIGDRTSGAPAVSRKGIAAISPASGLALRWNPGIKTRLGGKALTATRQGLWIGDDAQNYGREQHYGIVFAPL